MFPISSKSKISFFSFLLFYKFLVKEGQENKNINYVAATTEFICVVYVVSCFVFSGNNSIVLWKQQEIIHFTPFTLKKFCFLFIVIFKNDFSIFTFACSSGVRNFSGKEKGRKGRFMIISILQSLTREWQRNFLVFFWLSREISSSNNVKGFFGISIDD